MQEIPAIPAIPDTTATQEAEVIGVTQAIPATLVRQETPETTVQEGTVEVVAPAAEEEAGVSRLFLAQTALPER